MAVFHKKRIPKFLISHLIRICHVLLEYRVVFRIGIIVEVKTHGQYEQRLLVRLLCDQFRDFIRKNFPIRVLKIVLRQQVISVGNFLCCIAGVQKHSKNCGIVKYMILLKIFVDMLTAHTIKIIQSLDKKKYRQKYNLFLVEGNKIIKELPNSGYTISDLYSTAPELLDLDETSIQKILPAELRKISFLQNPKDSVAVCAIPAETKVLETNIQIVLDGIQDPGNLGTIIRLADWFGIEQIICSQDTVDLYNPKVIQATMGSFLRVNVVYLDIEDYLKKYQHPILGTDMDGDNIYKTDFPEKFSIIFGNEGNGIRPSTESLVNQMITIPRFGKHQSTESLNVSMSAGIILGEIFSKH